MPFFARDIKQTRFKPGAKMEVPLIGRSSLHAHLLEFVHPKDGTTKKIEAPLPKDFRATLNQLRKWV